MAEENTSKNSKDNSSQNPQPQVRGKDLRQLMDDSAEYGEEVRKHQSGADEVKPIIQHHQEKASTSSKKSK